METHQLRALILAARAAEANPVEAVQRALRAAGYVAPTLDCQRLVKYIDDLDAAVAALAAAPKKRFL